MKKAQVFDLLIATGNISLTVKFLKNVNFANFLSVFLAKPVVSQRDGRGVLCNFCFIQISAEILPNKSKTANFNGFFSKYILKTDAVVGHLSANSYAKFVGCHEHPKTVIVLYDLANSFYKKQVFTVTSLDSANNPYKLKFHTKIRKYPAMPFMVMRFKERNLQRRIWNCLKPYNGSFSKIGEIEI